jgi:threonine dehydratase
MTDLTVADIEQARVRIRGQIISTPLIDVTLPRHGSVAMKAEYLPPSGSFKIRGTTNCVAQLSSEQRQRGDPAVMAGQGTFLSHRGWRW